MSPRKNMIRKILLCSLAACALAVMPVSADTATYSDEYVSFDYDDEMPGEITLVTPEGLNEAIYSIVCAGTAPSASDVAGVFIYNNSDPEMRSYIRQRLGMLDPNMIKKVFRNEAGIYAYVTRMSTSTDLAAEQYVDMIVNTLCIQSQVLASANMKYIEKIIYDRTCYSQEAVAVAKCAMNVLTAYRDHKCSALEAAALIRKLQGKLRVITSTTGTFYDQRIYDAINTIDQYIEVAGVSQIYDSQFRLHKILSSIKKNPQ